MPDRRAFVKSLFALPALLKAPLLFAAAPGIGREEALALALEHADVSRRDVRNLKIEDFDVAVARWDGRVVDADIELREEWVRRQRPAADPEGAARREAARRVPGARPEDVRLRREGSRWEGVLRHEGFKAEFEADRRTGILFDWNLERRD